MLVMSVIRMGSYVQPMEDEIMSVHGQCLTLGRFLYSNSWDFSVDSFDIFYFGNLLKKYSISIYQGIKCHVILKKKPDMANSFHEFEQKNRARGQFAR